MNQCVPSWDLDDPNPAPPRLRLDIPLSTAGQQTNLMSPGAAAVPMSDFEVAELTWENGNISSRGIVKAMAHKYNPAMTVAAVPSVTGIAWAKQQQQLSGGGTLEEVVNEATRGHMLPPAAAALPAANLVPWTSAMHAAAQAAVDLLVPCGRDDIEPTAIVRKRARVVGEDGRVCASQGSTAPGRGESTLVTLDTCGGGGAGAGEDMAFTTTTNNSTSLSPLDGEGGGSPETENASIGGGGANDSICHSQRSKRDMVCDEEENMEPKVETGRASISTKRSRAAAVHNESERKRRDRINQKMKTLQRLVPNSSKTDKASMLDEVIDYLKQLQTQVNMMSRMMMPMAAMPPLQMSMMANMAQMAQMAQMGMGVGPPMVNLGSMSQPSGYSGMPTSPLLHPSTFVPFNVAGWDGASDRLKQQAGASAMPSDPFSAFLACQAAQQSVSMDAYSRIAALYQQMYQQNQPPNSKP